MRGIGGAWLITIRGQWCVVRLPVFPSSRLPVFPSFRLTVRNAGGKSVAGAKISLLLVLIFEKSLPRCCSVSFPAAVQFRVSVQRSFVSLRRGVLKERMLSRNVGAVVARDVWSVVGLAADCVGTRCPASRQRGAHTGVTPRQPESGRCHPPIPPATRRTELPTTRYDGKHRHP